MATVLVALAALAIGAARAASCDSTGAAAPDAVTLMASTKNPSSEAWVVSPDCSVETLTLYKGALDARAKSVVRVVGVPAETTSIDLTQNSLTRGADLSSATKLTSMSLSMVPTDPTNLQLPPALRTLGITSLNAGDLTSLDGVKFPDTLETLDIRKSGLKSLKNVQLPAKLKQLKVRASKLTTLDFQLPPALEQIELTTMEIGKLEDVALPMTLVGFTCSSCGITAIRGVTWPTTLETLNLDGNDIATFEIRKADLTVFKNLDSLTAKVAQTSCSGSSKLQSVGSIPLCVVSDTGSGSENESSNSSGGGSSSKTSKSSTTDSSRSLQGGDSNSGTADTSPLGSGNSNGSSSGTRPNASGERSPTASSGPFSPTDAVASNSESSTSTSNLIIIILSCALAVAIGIALFRVWVARKRQQRDADAAADDATLAKYSDANTPSYVTTGTKSELEESELGSVAMILRNDKDILRFRVDQTDIRLDGLIVRGGYGVVYRGSFQDRDVAIKQMLPETWRSRAILESFLAEIRMCARLEHPKIVEFIGIAWSSVRDLTIVTEYIGGGDLHSVLRTNVGSSGSGWFESWTTKHIRAKALIAMDVAEAVVYLHSFSSPIIHRDLKAKNVLLDPEGNAKLSDFGISRELSIDETMTSEIGTAAWIAPEVLRGERYSEKADIYSLGVLLVELDRCSHPYANEPLLMAESSSKPIHGDTWHVAHKNTQIAVLVSTGKLKPSVSPECPEVVARTVGLCLSHDASERPTSMEVFYELRQIVKLFPVG